MLAKRILAGFFAVIILLKLIIWGANPNLWIGAVEALLGHHLLVMLIYLGLLVLTGYYVFSSLDLINLAVAMFFTSLLMALTILPYAAAFLKLREEISSIGVGQAWLAAALWGALALAVLYKIFSPPRKE